MKQQDFQPGEIRDENDNILEQGAYGKKTPFTNGNNTGILDYIMNNFRALKNLVTNFATQAEAEAGTDDAKIMTPVRVWDAVKKWFSDNTATQAEAEAGTDNTKIMTPLKVDHRLKADRMMPTYLNLASLGLTIGSETIDDIIVKMPLQSILFYHVTTSYADIYPNKYGVIEIVKLSSNRISLRYTANNGKAWFGYYDNGFSGWREVHTDKPPSIYQRNSYYRGKDLGTFSSVEEFETFLSEHEVSTGVFSDVFVGDYLTIKDGTYNAVWLVAGIDVAYNKGDTAFSKHHLMLIPRAPLFNAVMNDTNTTEGGYKGSRMFTETLPALATQLRTVLGDHLLTRRCILSNAINTSASSGAISTWSGASNGWEWTDVDIVLPSEAEIYGGRVVSSSFYDIGEANSRLPIFHFINPVQFSRWNFWLRCVASSSNFCRCHGHGNANYSNASNSSGVRPLICVG